MIDRYIQQYGRRLYGLCLTLCADRHDADDLYQDTWLKAVANIDKYDNTKEFEGWLTAICVNLYRNTLRRIRRSPIWDGFASNEEKTPIIESIAAEETPDYSDLHAAIDKLPDKLRLTIILFYFRDMDISQTARVLNIPEGTVKSRLNKARKILKEVLTGETDIQIR